ncbi:MAG: toll/interleukin-1 receptor domain-containing protein [Deltaproteobacteria bacterium]|nr:MAG: toll/interleukin-1 receptor domain-containing protein [Deltaproteobacteria bacterium]
MALLRSRLDAAERTFMARGRLDVHRPRCARASMTSRSQRTSHSSSRVRWTSLTSRPSSRHRTRICQEVSVVEETAAGDSMPARVFVSYSRRDAQYKDKVLKQLGVLETQGLVATWSDDRIRVGNPWYEELTNELKAANIVVLLITANFLTSDFILKEEIPRAFENQREAGARIVPVLCRPCAWETVDWLNRLQIWPSNAQALWTQERDDPEQLLSDLAREIARIVGRSVKQVPKHDVVNEPTMDERLMVVEAQYGHGLMGVAEMIRVTIAKGAPLYNSGDHEACATIYRHAITFMLSRLTPVLQKTQRPKSSSLPVQRGTDIADGPRRGSMPLCDRERAGGRSGLCSRRP